MTRATVLVVMLGLCCPVMAASPGSELRGTYVHTPAEGVTQTPRSHGFRTLYLNRSGGTYTHGQTSDSSNNISSIAANGSVVAALDLTDNDWDDVMRCVILLFGPFGVTVTDVDPGSEAHVEAVVGGTPGQIGKGGGIGGIAPQSCGVIDRAIVFIFSAVYRDDTETLCEVIAQEVAHAYGLEHEFLCSDPMTYLDDCGPKKFQDTSAACGELSPWEKCDCGGAPTQNSAQLLKARLGHGDLVPPVVDISSPANGATVVVGFDVVADVTDNVLVAKVEFSVDGILRTEMEKGPFTYSTIGTLLVPGAHMVDVRAFDQADNITVTTITLDVEAECNVASECETGEVCEDFRCVVPMGSTCQLQSDCESGLLCVAESTELGASRICTQTCTPGGSTCPAEYACVQNIFGSGKCFPDTGSGCSVATATSGFSALGGVLLGLAAFLLVLWVRSGTSRRRRH